MASWICQDCDFYQPKHPKLLGRECAVLKKCTEQDHCGVRIPPITDDERRRHLGHADSVQESDQITLVTVSEVRVNGAD